MASTSMTAVNPSHLYFAAAAAPSPVSAPSPASSKGSATAQPSRKRPRTDFQTSEERKEARAERNRIAAQVSRDRRKAEFSDLRDRVSFLERENAALRQQAATSTSLTTPATSSLGLAQVPAIGTTSHTVEIERENRELKERVRVLENALSTLSQNVANALKGVGTGSSIGGALSHLLPASPSTSILPPTSNMTAQTTPTAPVYTATTTPVNATTPLVGASASSSTRHLARVACVLSPSLDDETSLQRVEPTEQSASSLLPPTPTPTTPSTQAPSHQPTQTLKIGSSNTSTAAITSTPSPSTPLSTSSPFLLQASSPSASSSSADTDLSALLHTPLVETSSPLLTTVGVSTSSPSLPMVNGTFEVASLFGDDNETDMEKLLAMLPPAGNATSSTSDAAVPEDMWMSNWLKEEPITQGTGVF
ncbi:hypothetical protein FRC00_008659 [Tulasnella sp. 408]|nr:hypothetical protein FRC00_008659 [Tulasnella sp. 408]